MSPTTTYLLESLALLIVLTAIATAVVWWGRRRGMGPEAGPLRLVARLRLDARRAVYVVRLGEVAYVIGASDSGLSKLGELPASELPATTLAADSPLVLPFLRRVPGLGEDEPPPPKDVAS